MSSPRNRFLLPKRLIPSPRATISSPIAGIHVLETTKTNQGIQSKNHFGAFITPLQVSEMVADKGKKPEIGEKIMEDNTEQIMSLFYPLQSCRRSKMNLKRLELNTWGMSSMYKSVILLHISQRNSG
ncbi:hypothetical protein Ccrd_019311 [Cynara cardunculus var. scolymus]|uniref:Uncharacterized protein n=1 Tax=Cynara cardunculus var. scolymus TaxID=59895 RepID=A0A103Y4M6_CYNCS|nr:hypothetical protein Ccrd_019311 [Cynara cardunculus var. scolymus]